MTGKEPFRSLARREGDVSGAAVRCVDLTRHLSSIAAMLRGAGGLDHAAKGISIASDEESLPTKSSPWLRMLRKIDPPHLQP